MAIITIEEAKLYCNANDPTDEEVSVLQGIVNGVSTAIKTYCGTAIEEETVTEYLNGTGERFLFLFNRPVISITTVTRISDDVAETEVVVASTEYRLDTEQGMLIMHAINYVDSSIWIVSDRNYKVVYKAGYASIPADIKTACEIWVNVIFKGFNKALFAVDTTSIGEQDITITRDSIPKEAMILLDPYVLGTI